MALARLTELQLSCVVLDQVEDVRVGLKAGRTMGLAVVRDLRERRAPASPEELADFETDVLAGFVLARASAGLADGTIRSDIGHLEQTLTWFGRPLWDLDTLASTLGLSDDTASHIVIATTEQLVTGRPTTGNAAAGH